MLVHLADTCFRGEVEKRGGDGFSDFSMLNDGGGRAPYFSDSNA